MFKSDLFWHEHNFSVLMWSMLMSLIYEKILPLYVVAFLTGLGVSTTCQLPVLTLIPVLLGCAGVVRPPPPPRLPHPLCPLDPIQISLGGPRH